MTLDTEIVAANKYAYDTIAPTFEVRNEFDEERRVAFIAGARWERDRLREENAGLKAEVEALREVEAAAHGLGQMSGAGHAFDVLAQALAKLDAVRKGAE